MEDFQILIGGAAGQGSKAAGQLIAKVLNRYGYKIFIYEDYPSLIRGGHNFSLIRASKEEKRSIKKDINFLLALNEDTIDKHSDKLTGDLLFNSDKVDCDGIGVAIESIAKEHGEKIMQNTALLGAFCKLVGVEIDVLEKVVNGMPKPKENLKVAKEAYESVENKYEIDNFREPSPLITGNEALSLGALEAGLENYFAYPMTPSTSILHFLADLRQEYDIQVMQPENEISVINTALGAAFAGKRSMVGTSGGGLALMGEGVSLAAISETPLVIVDSQRAGPASGVPTYNAQSDLNFALSVGHGDFLRFLFTPGDAEEAFYLTNLAMNLTWKYQIPAIMLIDKDISESTFSFDDSVLEKAEYWEEEKGENSKDYNRYADTETGISPLCYPGGDATVRSTSYEHDEYGTTTEKPEEIVKMQDKRMKKKPMIEEELERLEMVKTFGEGEKALVTWGSSKMAAKEAGKKLGFKVVQIMCFAPFPEKQFEEALEGVEEVVVVEANRTGQAANIIDKYVDVDKTILKYDGRPFYEEEIINELK
ncbi:MAG: 2-oxoacid:acceptor oxidoreductase subunit alpha [Patescibacteria group bacterium]